MSDTTIGLDRANGAGAPAMAPAGTATEKKTRGTVTSDPEVTAMAKISKIINELSTTDRETVVAWFTKKFV